MPWSDERRVLLTRIEELSLLLRPPKSRETGLSERREAAAERERLLLEYAENLPLVAASRCPFCQELFQLPMDTALDGPWWRHLSPVPMPAPRSCEHYRLFLGAIDLHGRTPTEVRTGVIAGPGAPFVIDRLLGLEGMQVVLSTLPLAQGDTAYLMTYFADAPTHPSALHPCWRKETWVLHNDAGDAVASKTTNDPWNFDLLAHLEAKQLSWIAPGDGSMTLRSDAECPYLDLPGTHMAQLIQSGQLRLSPPPDGSETGFYERS